MDGPIPDPSDQLLAGLPPLPVKKRKRRPGADVYEVPSDSDLEIVPSSGHAPDTARRKLNAQGIYTGVRKDAPANGPVAPVAKVKTTAGNAIRQSASREIRDYMEDRRHSHGSQPLQRGVSMPQTGRSSSLARQDHPPHTQRQLPPQATPIESQRYQDQAVSHTSRVAADEFEQLYAASQRRRSTLSSGVKWNENEDRILRRLRSQGNSCAEIAKHLPGRNHEGVKKRLARLGGVRDLGRPLLRTQAGTFSSPATTAGVSSPISLEATQYYQKAAVAPKWTPEEDRILLREAAKGTPLADIAQRYLPRRTRDGLRKRQTRLDHRNTVFNGVVASPTPARLLLESVGVLPPTSSAPPKDERGKRASSPRVLIISRPSSSSGQRTLAGSSRRGDVSGIRPSATSLENDRSRNRSISKARSEISGPKRPKAPPRDRSQQQLSIEENGIVGLKAKHMAPPSSMDYRSESGNPEENDEAYHSQSSLNRERHNDEHDNIPSDSVLGHTRDFTCDNDSDEEIGDDPLDTSQDIPSSPPLMDDYEPVPSSPSLPRAASGSGPLLSTAKLPGVSLKGPASTYKSATRMSTVPIPTSTFTIFSSARKRQMEEMEESSSDSDSDSDSDEAVSAITADKKHVSPSLVKKFARPSKLISGRQEEEMNDATGAAKSQSPPPAPTIVKQSGNESTAEDSASSSSEEEESSSDESDSESEAQLAVEEENTQPAISQQQFSPNKALHSASQALARGFKSVVAKVIGKSATGPTPTPEQAPPMPSSTPQPTSTPKITAPALAHGYTPLFSLHKAHLPEDDENSSDSSSSSDEDLLPQASKQAAKPSQPAIPSKAGKMTQQRKISPPIVSSHARNIKVEPTYRDHDQESDWAGIEDKSTGATKSTASRSAPTTDLDEENNSDQSDAFDSAESDESGVEIPPAQTEPAPGVSLSSSSEMEYFSGDEGDVSDAESLPSVSNPYFDVSASESENDSGTPSESGSESGSEAGSIGQIAIGMDVDSDSDAESEDGAAQSPPRNYQPSHNAFADEGSEQSESEDQAESGFQPGGHLSEMYFDSNVSDDEVTSKFGTEEDSQPQQAAIGMVESSSEEEGDSDDEMPDALPAPVGMVSAPLPNAGEASGSDDDSDVDSTEVNDGLDSDSDDDSDTDTSNINTERIDAVKLIEEAQRAAAAAAAAQAASEARKASIVVHALDMAKLDEVTAGVMDDVKVRMQTLFNC